MSKNMRISYVFCFSFHSVDLIFFFLICIRSYSTMKTTSPIIPFYHQTVSFGFICFRIEGLLEAEMTLSVFKLSTCWCFMCKFSCWSSRWISGRDVEHNINYLLVRKHEYLCWSDDTWSMKRFLELRVVITASTYRRRDKQNSEYGAQRRIN